ncbi:MAG TPA: peptide-methionine (R)-S-oxide reductase MsrB [Chlamydiales bacterium]|nr:peptide-methionine (R)-S-oxide reductase MsrB [Chlamydiales bacterium]
MIFLWIFLTVLAKEQTPKTERAFSGKYLYETAPGIYRCAECKNALFKSEDKYDSGAGWPSFTKPVETESVYYLEDWSLPFKRYEVLCRKCNSHLGHVFNDGPPPKGLRYCINSVTLIHEIVYDH